VIAAGLQFHRRARLEIDTFHRTHRHHPAFHGHFVNRNEAGDR
jgi:hypothetical protein